MKKAIYFSTLLSSILSLAYASNNTAEQNNTAHTTTTSSSDIEKLRKVDSMSFGNRMDSTDKTDDEKSETTPLGNTTKPEHAKFPTEEEVHNKQ